jgi:hypothetical protein
MTEKRHIFTPDALENSPDYCQRRLFFYFCSYCYQFLFWAVSEETFMVSLHGPLLYIRNVRGKIYREGTQRSHRSRRREVEKEEDEDGELGRGFRVFQA